MGWNTRPREAEELSSRTSPSQPPWNGELHLKPWRLLLSWRRRSTRAFSTCTRWPEIRATATSGTSLSPSTSESRWRHQVHRRPDHQDEESRRRTRTAFDRQGDGILNFSNHTKPQLAAITFTDWFQNKQFFVLEKKKKKKKKFLVLEKKKKKKKKKKKS